MSTEALIEAVDRQLFWLLREDPALRLVELTLGLRSGRDETAIRFDRMLEELRRDRDEQSRKRDHAELTAQSRKFASGHPGTRRGARISDPGDIPVAARPNIHNICAVREPARSLSLVGCDASSTVSLGSKRAAPTVLPI
jgi:hypothetical protein